MTALFRGIDRSRFSRRDTEAAIAVDFTGGLNLCADPTTLAPNESKDMCNVDPQPNGGLCRRNAVQPFAGLLKSPICSVPICYESDDGVAHMIVELEDGCIVDIFNGPVTGLYQSDGPSGVSQLGWEDEMKGECKLEGCYVCGNLYVTKGAVWYRWDGNSLVPLPTDFRIDEFEQTGLPNLDVFCNTGIPSAQTCAVWDSRFWVARTVIAVPCMEDVIESTTVGEELGLFTEEISPDVFVVVNSETGEQIPLEDYEGVPVDTFDNVCRTDCVGQQPVRDADGCIVYKEEYDCAGLYYSLAFGPGQAEGPEDFVPEFNYRLKTDGNDCITKLVPHGDRMYVFQQNSIHAITPFFGEPVDITYQVVPYQSNVGAIGEKACCSSGGSVWFFDNEEGLMQIDGEGSLINHFDKIRCILTDGTLAGDRTMAAVGCCDGRVWLSLPEAGETRNTITYVYDPRLGSWTVYKLGFDCFKDYQPTGIGTEPCDPQTPRESHCLGVMTHPCPTIVTLDREPQDCEDNRVDDFGHLTQPIESWYATRWHDADLTEAVKEWCGTEVLASTDVGQSMLVSGFSDWSDCDFAGSYLVETTNPKSKAKALFDADGKLGLGLELVECNVNNPESRPRQPRRSERQFSKPVLGPDELLPQPTRVGKFCPSRALCLRFEPQGNGKWNLHRLTMFFKRKPVRC